MYKRQSFGFRPQSPSRGNGGRAPQRHGFLGNSFGEGTEALAADPEPVEELSLIHILVWVRALWGLYRRVAKSNFPFRDWVLAPLGIPLYAALLWRSWFRVTVLKQVVWKGREQGVGSRQ